MLRSFTQTLINAAERGWVPDPILRVGIRHLLKRRIAKEDQGSAEGNLKKAERLAEKFSRGPIAEQTDKANEQHYEVPATLFELMLGPQRKYSSCCWDESTHSLTDAESLALDVTVQRAEIVDGQRILELGCGWGSLTLSMAKRFPKSTITAISNSASQRDFILAEARSRGLSNLEVITCDMNDFTTDQRFDRAISVEMFEHMKNYRELLHRISHWLCDEGKLFVHIFCHAKFTYEFQDEGEADWMARHFFSGGVMPSESFLRLFDDDLQVTQQWKWNGKHYQHTCEAWLKNMDSRRKRIMPVLESTYGKAEATRWFNRWRMFHLACSELFGFGGGDQWYVSHYLFEKSVKGGASALDGGSAQTNIVKATNV